MIQYTNLIQNSFFQKSGVISRFSGKYLLFFSFFQELNPGNWSSLKTNPGFFQPYAKPAKFCQVLIYDHVKFISSIGQLFGKLCDDLLFIKSKFTIVIIRVLIIVKYTHIQPH
ncbi:Hypothetical_protein [Hexamita inflata]|uniref:Hypothetical_protein n=1 Tax=Hexamita inflata TaxID=28002 RepID=A0AA86Q8C5_9EUKA|nr:Hypothetical protein HINF_LOCUS35589 [Hexamita inflata]